LDKIGFGANLGSGFSQQLAPKFDSGFDSEIFFSKI